MSNFRLIVSVCIGICILNSGTDFIIQQRFCDWLFGSVHSGDALAAVKHALAHVPCPSTLGRHGRPHSWPNLTACVFENDVLPPDTGMRADRVHAELYFVHQFLYKQCGIPYTLTRGTLLNAVRHRGHNPADNDGDIIVHVDDPSAFLDDLKAFVIWLPVIDFDHPVHGFKSTAIHIGVTSVANSHSRLLSRILAGIQWGFLAVAACVADYQLIMCCILLIFTYQTTVLTNYLSLPMKTDVFIFPVNYYAEATDSRQTLYMNAVPCVCPFGPLDLVCPSTALQLVKSIYGPSWFIPQ